MSQDTSYDYPGSYESLGRRRRRGLITRDERALQVPTTFHAPHLELREVNRRLPTADTGRESILE